jgi:hypothetical protein
VYVRTPRQQELILLSKPTARRLAEIFGSLAEHYSEPSDASSEPGICTNDRCESKNVQTPLTLGNCPECDQPLAPLPTTR